MNEKTRDLIALISDHLRRLESIAGSIEDALENEIELLGRTDRSALIIAGLLENYYTCLETIFVRISQFFENNLDQARWHSDLLQKMTLEIPGVRARVVSEKNFASLFELLKFRYFRRYYYELEYDWDRLDFLVTMLRKAHKAVREDFVCFLGFLNAIQSVIRAEPAIR